MKAMTGLLIGQPDGWIRLECDRMTCLDWSTELPPNSTLVDIERALKRHTHTSGRKTA